MQNQPSTFTENGKTARIDRLYFLDWLRVFAILLVFLVHCSKIFDYHTTVVFNTVRSPILSAFRDFSLLWIMPLFFVLSGAAVFLSKGSDKTGEFIKSRVLRLLVPLIFIGTFIINPLYVFTLNGYPVARLPAAFSGGTRNISMASMDLAAILRPWGRERISGIWNSSLSTH